MQPRLNCWLLAHAWCRPTATPTVYILYCTNTFVDCCVWYS